MNLFRSDLESKLSNRKEKKGGGGMVWKLVFQLMLMMLMFQVAAAAAPIARSGCPDRCGDISIHTPSEYEKIAT